MKLDLLVEYRSHESQIPSGKRAILEKHGEYLIILVNEIAIKFDYVELYNGLWALGSKNK